MKKRLAKTTDTVKADHMKDMYAKIDKEDRRRKRWRWLKNLTENVLGGFSLIIYLVLITAVIFGIYWGVTRIIYPMISDNLEEQPAPEVEGTE